MYTRIPLYIDIILHKKTINIERHSFQTNIAANMLHRKGKEK